jgi:hypothetical protein
LIILIMFGEEYMLWSCSLCSFLHSPLTLVIHLIFSLLERMYAWSKTVVETWYLYVTYQKRMDSKWYW